MATGKGDRPQQRGEEYIKRTRKAGNTKGGRGLLVGAAGVGDNRKNSIVSLQGVNLYKETRKRNIDFITILSLTNVYAIKQCHYNTAAV